MSGPAPRSPRRVRARVTGTVQGVGFRPSVYRLARDLGIGGFVLNDEHGVLIEAEGGGEEVVDFLRRLRDEAPPLAEVAAIEVIELAPRGEADFAIRPSAPAADPEVLVPADAATCEACLDEVSDPRNRRFRYPFTNCTDCGPRFTIVRGVPYDRSRTTMAGFEMCDACRSEYSDPLDRRFHAEPNACPRCGPRTALVDRHGKRLSLRGTQDPVAAAARCLREGMIVAVKGLGGFHLAARADSEAAVGALRARKRRDAKPFALMARDLAQARELVELTAAESAMLLGRERPIVIARRSPQARVAEAVAAANADLGVMLPYSPLHHLLAADSACVLVMTSGNLTDEPICVHEADALSRLGGIADAFLTHDRPIETRADDSVVRAIGSAFAADPLVIRRSRGFAPHRLRLPVPGPPLLACGAELKSTFCVAKDEHAWVSHHIGDLTNLETLQSFSQGVRHFERLFGVDPVLVAHDLHPDYLSTVHALGIGDVEHLAVQHHHAHLAAVLAEHGEPGPAVGAIFDGAGLGSDKTVWGGEVLAGTLSSAERLGHLEPVRLPGGDAAAHEPWRMACAWLAAVEGGPPAIPRPLRRTVSERAWRDVCELVRTGLGSPLTTSAGRLFDAIAAICGIRAVSAYEGQAAMELESVAASAWPAEPYEIPVGGPDPLGLDARPAVAQAAADVSAGIAVPVVAARFHAGMAAATALACAGAAERIGTEVAVLAGGVFQNRLLLEATVAGLRTRGLRVLVPHILPPNDGAISFGQAAVAAACRPA